MSHEHIHFGIDLHALEQRTAERIIKGKHKPSVAHWRIRKAGPNPKTSWDVLEPLQYYGYFDRPQTFDTFAEACAHVAAKVDEFFKAQPTYGRRPAEYFIDPTPISPYTLSAAPMHFRMP